MFGRQAGEAAIRVENWSEVVRDHLEGEADGAKRVVSVHDDLAQRYCDRGARFEWIRFQMSMAALLISPPLVESLGGPCFGAQRPIMLRVCSPCGSSQNEGSKGAEPRPDGRVGIAAVNSDNRAHGKTGCCHRAAWGREVDSGTDPGESS